MTKYHYIECGLENVFIEGLTPMVDDDGDEVITIPHVAELHAEIARGIITQDGAMDGTKLRFLRSEMGMTQANLAKKVNKDGQTIGRWERNEITIDPNAEVIIRQLVGERLIDAFDQKIERLMEHAQANAENREITIRKQDNHYELCA